ncbi:MAG: hypothetical protein ACYC3F_12255 [Gemmatimonadaceae bacterium]
MAVIVLLLIAGSLWRPEWKWLDAAALLTLVVGISVSFALQTEADRARVRRSGWIIPAVALAVAAQWVYLADVEDRDRTLILGVALVVVASAIAWLRKRAR